MIIKIDTERLSEALKIEGIDDNGDALISVSDFQKALSIARVNEE
jgi:hypothetical protein